MREHAQFKSSGDSSKNYCANCLLTNADVENAEPELPTEHSGIVLHQSTIIQGRGNVERAEAQLTEIRKLIQHGREGGTINICCKQNETSEEYMGEAPPMYTC